VKGDLGLRGEHESRSSGVPKIKAALAGGLIVSTGSLARSPDIPEGLGG
jgi:hypothetical protein